MFCTNCGKPVPDGSRFCPYCGTPVAGSADGLSYEDVLKKVNKQKEEKIYPIFCSPEDDSLELRPFHDGERGKYVFDVDGCHFEYDERQVGFIRLAKAMTKEALSDKELKRIYWKNDSVEELLQFFTSEEAAEQIMGSVLKKESSLLLSRGIYGLTKDNLMARDMADGAPSALDAWQDFVQSLLGQVGKITGNAEAERTYRELRKEYRGRIIGGGFGLGGALQGMITAGVLNLASGAAHSIFNAIGNAFTNSWEKKQLDDLFHSDNLLKSFIATYRLSVFYLTMDAADRLNLIPPDLENIGLPEAIQTAIDDGSLEKSHQAEAAAYALANAPHTILSYQLFYLNAYDKDGIVDRIAEAFGLSEKLENTKFLITKRILEYVGKKRNLPLADLLNHMHEGNPIIDRFMALNLLAHAGDIAETLHNVHMTFPYPLLDELKHETEHIAMQKESSQKTDD
ncbi:MAG: zinc ribbon domain-containing protein [Caecibacter massiliensis]|nr:zinc ribbon domain-containing protein [Caecibacter massiliensis]